MTAKAAELRETANRLRYQSSQGSSTRAARKWEQVRRLEHLAALAERRERKPAEPFDYPF